MARRASPDWRDRAAVDLLLRQLGKLEPPTECLILEERLPDPGQALADVGANVREWNRRAVSGREATPWPIGGPFDAAFLRLPPAKEELAMCIHAAGSVLRPDGRLVVYGANDEGIQSAVGAMDELFSGVETVGVGGRCRVLAGVRRENQVGLKGGLDAWRRTWRLRLEGRELEWVSYPGVFADGRLDSGTELLLEVLPAPVPGARVLDYGCGSGLVGRVAMDRASGVKLDLLDIDAVALEAARENVPEGRVVLQDGLPGADDGRYDMVVSNPPFHRGKAEDPAMLSRFIEGASRLIGPRGSVTFVAQARLSLGPEMDCCFGRVDVLASTRGFRVWKGGAPADPLRLPHSRPKG